VDKVISFKWEIEEFPTNMALLNTRQEPLTSNVFRNGRDSWRALLTQDMDLFLQLVSAANPVTVEIRFVMMPGGDKEEVFFLSHTTLKEGQMWGLNLQRINKWVEENGKLRIKFIIYFLRF